MNRGLRFLSILNVSLFVFLAPLFVFGQRGVVAAKGEKFIIRNKLDFTAVDAAGGLKPRSRQEITGEFGVPDQILPVEGLGPIYIWLRHVFVDKQTSKEYRKLTIVMNRNGTAASITGVASLEVGDPIAARETVPQGGSVAKQTPQLPKLQLPKLALYPKPLAPKPTKKGQLTLKNGKGIHANVTRISDLWVSLDNLDSKKREQYPLYYLHGRELERDTKKLDDYLALEGMKPSRSEFVFGVALFHGLRGTERNVGLAIQKFTNAARAGNTTAFAWLQWIYQSGDGVDANLQLATAWRDYAANVQRARMIEEKLAISSTRKANQVMAHATGEGSVGLSKTPFNIKSKDAFLSELMSQTSNGQNLSSSQIISRFGKPDQIKKGGIQFGPQYIYTRYHFSSGHGLLFINMNSEGTHLESAVLRLR